MVISMVRAVDLGYQPKLRKLAVMAYVLLFIGASALIAAIFYTHLISEQSLKIKADIARIQHPEVDESSASFEASTSEIKAMQEAMGAIRLPWETLFYALESIDAPSVRLISFEPDARQGQVRITAEAAVREDMLSYVSALGKQDVLSDVLLKEHMKSDKDTEYPIRFTVEALWVIKP